MRQGHENKNKQQIQVCDASSGGDAMRLIIHIKPNAPFDRIVGYIGELPRKGDRFPVKDIDEALKLLDTLANNDLKNDHVWANAGGLEIYTEDGWEEYYNSDGNSIDEIRLQKSEDDLNENIWC